MAAKNKHQGKTNAVKEGKQAKQNGNGGKAGKGGKGAKGAKASPKVELAQKPGKVGGQSLEIRHILCTKESRMKEALEKIQEPNDTLANFINIAKEYSEDKAKLGGYLGWQTKAALDADFTKIAWALEKSQGGKVKTNIARTANGYHIIVVTGQK